MRPKTSYAFIEAHRKNDYQATPAKHISQRWESFYAQLSVGLGFRGSHLLKNDYH